MESAKVLRSNLLVLLVLGFLTILTESLVWAAPLNSETMGQAINIAGRQRMLTQKMAKEALLVHLKIDPIENSNHLIKTMKTFESSLKNLQEGSKALKIPKVPTPQIANYLQKVQSRWVDYKSALEAKNLDKIARLNLPILKDMNRAVKQYELASVTMGLKTNGKVINIAGRQRMLTQKMAKEVFLIAASVGEERQLKALKRTKELFAQSLDALINGSEQMKIKAPQSNQVKNQLKVVAGHWVTYQALVDKALMGRKALPPERLKEIAAINLVVLVEMNKAVGMIQAASAPQN